MDFRRVGPGEHGVPHTLDGLQEDLPFGLTIRWKGAAHGCFSCCPHAMAASHPLPLPVESPPTAQPNGPPTPRHT